MNKLFFSVLSFLSVFISFAGAQSYTTLSGTVTGGDAKALAGASIIVLNTNRGTVSDANGFFHLDKIFPGKYTVQVSAVGYAAVSKEVDLLADSKNETAFVLNETDTRLDAVVVTAQKKDEQLQQIPFSISALSARQVKEYRLWNAKDITAIVPNLNSTNGGDERNVTSIRGITTTSYDPAIATYVDGVNQFTLDSYSSQLLDIERIEVLRGPQGTLYGRNAMGGVINIITKQPGDKATVFAEVNFGNYNQQRYELGFKTPLIKNKLYLGAAGMYSKRDGYYTNTFNNRSFDDQKIAAGNYYLKYKPAEKWMISFNLRHQAHRNNGAYPLVMGVEDAFEKPYELSQNAVGEMVDNTMFSSLVINYAGRGFNFSSQTAYQNNYRYYKNAIDGDFSPADIVTIGNNYGKPWNKVKTWTQEFRFTSPAASASRLQWTAGTYLFSDDRPTRQATHYGEDAGLYGIPDINFSTINSSKGKGEGIAFYGQATYRILEKLDFTAGIRYDYEHKKYHMMGEYQPDGAEAIIIRPDTSSAVHSGAFSPRAGLTWRISDKSNVYGIYSRGFRTGGLTQLSDDPSQPPLYRYDPEYSNNFEAGIKNSFLQNRLYLNVAVFYTNITGVQVPTLVLPDAITIIRNAGKLNSKGFEIEATATPVKGLQLNYNFGYTNASYADLKLSQNGASVDLEGKKQIYTPEFTSMLSAQYSYTIIPRQQLKAIVRGEWMYLGRQYFDLNNSISQSPYSLLNARAGVSSKNADLMFWIRNLGAKKYIAYAYDFGAVHLGNPQTLGVTLGVRI
ncbi:MAG: TonB-dependent receptor [Chitinophagaceae bacterium]|nr:TonB-dependent receptor [Chitinophagaceae bacterium]